MVIWLPLPMSKKVIGTFPESPPAAENPLKPLGTVTGAGDVPAVWVKISKTADHNNGPLLLLFAPILGINTTNLSAYAVATMFAGVASMPAGAGFPMATPIHFVEEHWELEDTFRIGSDYHYPIEEAGQWTSFTTGSPSASVMKGFIKDGNSVDIPIGTPIYIQPGTENTGFINAVSRENSIVMLPIVHNNIQPKEWTPVLAFVPFFLEHSEKHGKYIEGHFVKDYVVPGTSGNSSAPFYGAKASNRVKLAN
jgi:hypothetical protein